MSSRTTLSDSGLKQAIDWLFDEKMFSALKQHGNTDWSCSALVTMALLWSWGDERGLRERFQSGLAILPGLYVRRQWGRTYQGFVKSLSRWSQPLLSVVKDRLRERMQQMAGPYWRTHGWVVMAVDGTRVEVPRTRSNEAHCARVPAHRQRKRKSSKTAKQKPQRQPAAPQIWLTAVWHVGLGMLWEWRQGPNGSNERAHLLEMVEGFPEHTLLVADAGFHGYEYWQALLEHEHSFVIRVGGNVRLLSGLGYVRRRRNIVYLWPDRVRKAQQPPIVLRLLEFHDGRRSMWLVTNVLDAQRLSTRQVRDLYRLRWGVEVFFRSFKQTFGRGKLRSHAPENAERELDWSLAALWSLELLAVWELLARDRPPCELSTAACLQAIRQALRNAAVGADFELCRRLAGIRDDGYHRRRKTARKWPRKKRSKLPGHPRTRPATPEEIQAAYELRSTAA